MSSNEDLIQTNSDAAENFSEYIKNPINLNHADENTLLSLGFLSETQIKEIMDYISQYGPVLNIYELQVLPSINQETFLWIKSCFTISENIAKWNIAKNIIGSDRSMLLICYTPEKPGSPKNWTGHSDKLSIRFQTSISNKMRIAFSMKKDAGEQLIWKPQQSYYGFDSWNGYVQYYPSRKWKQVTIGTYRLQFGQGLLMGGGFYPGKGSETITTLRKAGSLILPVGSTSEYARLTGISSTYQFSKNIFLTGFMSYTHEDAVIYSKDKDPYIKSITQTGYHRTETELAHRKNIPIALYGYHARFVNKHFSIGNTFLHRHVSYNIQPDNSYYNQFYIHGKNYYGTSIDLQWHFQNLVLFSEAAICNTNGKSILAGALLALNKKSDLSILYRNYSKEYNSPYAQAFGENTTVTNEKGMYLGIKIRPKKEWSIHAYADLFVFPWLKYRIHIPSDGEEYFFRVEYKPSKKTLCYFQYRYEKKYLNVSTSLITEPTQKSTSILYLEHIVSLSLTLRTRMQWGSYAHYQTHFTGYLFAQDLIYRKRKYQITLRWMIYDIEDYNVRLYAYEPDVPYSFYIPAYNGKALHPMIIVRYKLVKGIDLWIKGALTQPMINNGTDLSYFSSKSSVDWKCQLRWIF